MSLAPVVEVARGVSRPRSPYVGLVPYDVGDAAFFFGRSTEAAIVAANLRAAPLTILYGPSGVGKSSLLLAGAVHDLREDARAAAAESPFAVCVFRSWRDDPVHGVREAARVALQELAGAGPLPLPAATLAETFRAWTDRTGTLLVVLDQFEEYFQYHPDEGDDERLTGFAAELARIVNDPGLAVHVLLSVREDAWAKLDRFEGHIPSLFSNYVRVDHLDLEAAREAIEGPIEAWNRSLPEGEQPFEIEPVLVEAVLTATASGGLTLTAGSETPVVEAPGDRIEAPFLQLVLERLWRDAVAAGAHTLTLARLQALGGAGRIIENHLLDALSRLTPAEQDTASDCFRFLVSSGKTKIAHPATDLAEWTQRPEAQVTAVLDKLCTGESGRILRAIAPAQEEAQSTSYELFHDILAEPVLAWRRGYQQERDRRLALKRFARIGGVLLSLVAVFAALGIWALVQRSDAIGERRRAESRELAAEARGLLGGRLDDAIMLALESRDRADTVEARGALLTAVQRTSGLVRFLRFRQPVQALAAGPGGTIGVALADGTLVLLDRSGHGVGRLKTEGTTVDGVAFDPRRPLLAAGLGQTVKLLEVRRSADGRLDLVERWRANVDQKTIRSVAFSQDGRWLAAGGTGGVTLWRFDRTGQPHAVTLGGSHATVTTLAFGGARPRLAATSAGGLRVWDLRHTRRAPRLVESPPADALAFGPGGVAFAARGWARPWHGSPDAKLQPLRVGGGKPAALAFNRSGTLLASGDANGSVALWDVTRGRPLGPPLRGQGGKILSVAFEPGGSVLAVASADHTVALWDTRVRARVGTDLDLGSDHLTGASFGRNGILAVVTSKGALKVGDLDPAPPMRVTAHGVEQAAASPDGRRLVVATHAGVAAAALKADTALRPLRPPTLAQDVSVSRDGVIAAAARLEPRVRRWNAAGQTLRTLDPPAPLQLSVAWSVAISADGRRVAAGYWSGEVVLWRPVGDGAPKGVVLGTNGERVNDLAFDPDGTVLASGDSGGTIELWRVAKRGPSTRLEGHEGEVTSLAFAPNGEMLASGGDDGTVRLWDPQEGRSLGDPLRLGRPVSAVAFSPDGRWLIAVHGADGKLTAWDTTLWHGGKDTLDRVRQRFCAAVASDVAPSRDAVCRRPG